MVPSAVKAPSATVQVTDLLDTSKDECKLNVEGSAVFLNCFIIMIIPCATSSSN
jgi:hypothetical protein